jgi:hypothetical protein
VTNVSESSRQIRNVPWVGVGLVTGYLLATVLFWMGGIRSQARPDGLTWVLIGLTAANVGRLIYLLRRGWSYLARENSHDLALAQRLAWLSMFNTTAPVPIGCVIALISGQLWRLLPFLGISGMASVVMSRQWKAMLQRRNDLPA